MQVWIKQMVILLYYDIKRKWTENPDETNDRIFAGKVHLPVYQGGFGFNVDWQRIFYQHFTLHVRCIWIDKSI
jgi:hypothetical protein